MVKRVDPEFLNGPIPGMSLTAEPGSRPWENPPVFPTVEEAIAFYTEQILDPDTEDHIVNVLTKDISVEVTANQIISSGVMNGMHTIDVAFLIDPVIRELIMYVADRAGIDYIESYDKKAREKVIPRAMAMRIVDEVFSEALEEQQAPEEPVAPPMGGLMARPQAPAMGGMDGAMEPPMGDMAAGGGLGMPPEMAGMGGAL
jgi:hypothetical protein